MSDNEKIPPTIMPSEGGVTPNCQTNEATPVAAVTDTTIPQGPVSGQLRELAEQGSAVFGGRFGTQMTAVAFQQLEQYNHKLGNDAKKKDARISELQDENTELKVELAAKNATSASEQKTNWIMAGIFALSTLLISIGYSELSLNSGRVVLALGCVTFLVGFLYPLWGRK